jgi:hypothetical protein
VDEVEEYSADTLMETCNGKKGTFENFRRPMLCTWKAMCRVFHIAVLQRANFARGVQK